jgi:hypothetical protein
MSRTPPSKEGCFKVTHPSTTWEEVPCVRAPNIEYLPRNGGHSGSAAGGAGAAALTVGNGTDFSSAGSGILSWAEGTFPSVTGVTSATSNSFSLQLNSNTFFGPSACAGAADPSACKGWAQFIYAPSSAFIQYWLISYGSHCPSNWNQSSDHNSCYRNSSAVSVPTISPTNLSKVTLTGGTGSWGDTVTLSEDGSSLYHVTQANLVDLNQNWTDAEFNIFGNGNGSALNFNAGSTLVVQLLTTSADGTTAAATCGSDGTTGETNNLNLVSSSCCQMGGETPGIQFTESNVSGQAAAACIQDPVQQPSLLWWNGSSGQITGWVVNPDGSVPRTQTLGWQCTDASGCGSAWSPMSTLGNSIYWWNRSTGEVSTWVVDAEGGVTSPGDLSWTCGGSCASTWLMIGAVMEGTQSGVLWYNQSTGQLSIWDVSGTTVTGAETVSWTCGGSCASSWKLIRTGDINNDGFTDAIWQNPTTGVVSAWLLNGATVIGTQELSWTCSSADGCWGSWWMYGAVDVNGDGITDVTWYNEPTGQVSSWLLDGSGNVTGTQLLSRTCSGSLTSGCASTQFPIGFISFP